jgi:hypothetical protein
MHIFIEAREIQVINPDAQQEMTDNSTLEYLQTPDDILQTCNVIINMSNAPNCSIPVPKVVQNVDWYHVYGTTNDDPVWVSLYILISGDGVWMDGHIDPGGTAVWYILPNTTEQQGCKYFVCAPPTEYNRKKVNAVTFTYDKFTKLQHVQVIKLTAGNALFLPCGNFNTFATLQFQ